MNLAELQTRFNSGEKFNFIFFWGHKETPGKITNACFSQWYPANFTEDGISYNCAEQYMMAQKALLFDDKEVFDQIIKESDPGKIKKLGRLVKNFDEKIWSENCRRIVTNGNVLKFSQNAALKDYLLKTKDSILVEASPYDPIWGIKMRKEEADAKNPNKWKGTNYLGFCLVEAREIIKGL